jgi:hypothetical protein
VLNATTAATLGTASSSRRSTVPTSLAALGASRVGRNEASRSPDAITVRRVADLLSTEICEVDARRRRPADVRHSQRHVGRPSGRQDGRRTARVAQSIFRWSRSRRLPAEASAAVQPQPLHGASARVRRRSVDASRASALSFKGYLRRRRQTRLARGMGAQSAVSLLAGAWGRPGCRRPGLLVRLALVSRTVNSLKKS